jgi:hypothetical protein
LFNQWLPNGGSLASFAYMNLLGNGSVSPVVQTPGSLDVVADPLNSARNVLRCRIKQSDTRFSDSALKVMLNDVTPTASDPITDWSGQSAVRRWYRFSFMVTDWAEEPQRTALQQLTVIWQLHDQKDNNPDVYVEPPLWLIDNGRGGWDLWNTYDANQNTSDATKTRRIITTIPRVLNQWEDVAIWMKPSWTSGALKVWRNRRLIFQESGVPNCFNHQVANGGSYNFTEVGIYGGKIGQVTDRTVYHCGYQKGDEAYATFDSFMSAVGAGQTELESFTAGKVNA